jgi:hypothetical protein
MHNRLAINKPPQIGRETAKGFLDLEKPLGVKVVLISMASKYCAR